MSVTRILDEWLGDVCLWILGALAIFLYSVAETLFLGYVPPGLLLVSLVAVAVVQYPLVRFPYRRRRLLPVGITAVAIAAIWASPSVRKEFLRDAYQLRPGMTRTQVQAEIGPWLGRQAEAAPDRPWILEHGLATAHRVVPTDGEVRMSGYLVYLGTKESGTDDAVFMTMHQGRLLGVRVWPGD